MSMRTADPSEYAAMQSPDPSLTGVDASESVSVIDRHTTVDGTFHANRDLRIEGEVKGTIECQGMLHVAQGANVTAKIEAENVTIAGDLNGEVNCRGRLQIMPSGRLRGKVSTQSLVVNEGAFYEGQLEMAAPTGRPSTGPPPRSLPPVNAGTTPVPMHSQSASASAGRGTGTAPAGAEGQANSKTFIRRFGGPETPWQGESREDGPDSEPPPRDGQG